MTKKNIEDILKEVRGKYILGEKISTDDMKTVIPLMETSIKVLTEFGREFKFARDELSMMIHNFEAWIRARETMEKSGKQSKQTNPVPKEK